MTAPAPALILLALGMVTALGCAFARHNASSVLALPIFVAAVALLFGIPGYALLRFLRLLAPPLDTLLLSLSLGMAVSGAFYWIGVKSGRPALLWTPPLAALALALLRRPFVVVPGRAALREALRRIRAGHVLVLAVLSLALVPLLALPLFFRNAARGSGGSMSYYPLPDFIFHVSIANELRHTVPPQNPFLPGRPLSYHYYVDLLTALLASVPHLNTLDLTVRLVPTLFVTMLVLAAFCLGRAWFQSERVAALLALLVVLGEDLSFVPGLIQGIEQHWVLYYTAVPTVASLYGLNPTLPGTAQLFVCLLCLKQFLEGRGWGWLVAGMVVCVSLFELKVFTAAHFIAALLGAGALRLLLVGERRSLLAGGAFLAALLPFVAFTWQGNAGRITTHLDPWPYVLITLSRLGLGETSLAAQVLMLFEGTRTPGTALSYVALALPLWLALTFGTRLAGLPDLVRTLFRPHRASALALIVATMVAMGPPLSLLLSVTPTGYPPGAYYNNAVWFLIQSKHVAWLFALQGVARLERRSGRLAALVATAFLALSLPAAIQFFAVQAADPLMVLERPSVETLTALDTRVRPGAVCLAREEVAQAVLAVTGCRSLALDVFAYSFLGPVENLRLRQDRDDFWTAWQEGRVRFELLDRYGVDHVVAYGRHGVPPEAGLVSPGGGRLARVESSETLSVYDYVRPGPRPAPE